MTKRTIAAALLAAPVLAVVAPSAASATNKPDPCPGQHVQVYNKNSNTEVAHYVCGPIKGDTGATGPQGPKGDKGNTGDKGATGSAGPSGAPGAPGAPGADGATGPAGPAGPKGDAGTNGTDGDVGPQGPAGDAGATGAPGATGSQGETGAAGPVGPQGPAGQAGIDGVQGLIGPQGDTGAPGANAYIEFNAVLTDIMNQNGDCGTNGGLVYSIGTVGDENDDILVVCNGENGAPGTNGENGVAGAAGIAGTDGVSKTVIVHQDGSTEVVPTLPKTGAESETAWMLGFVGLGILAAGGGLLWVLRKQD